MPEERTRSKNRKKEKSDECFFIYVFQIAAVSKSASIRDRMNSYATVAETSNTVKAKTVVCDFFLRSFLMNDLSIYFFFFFEEIRYLLFNLLIIFQVDEDVKKATNVQERLGIFFIIHHPPSSFSFSFFSLIYLIGNWNKVLEAEEHAVPKSDSSVVAERTAEVLHLFSLDLLVNFLYIKLFFLVW